MSHCPRRDGLSSSLVSKGRGLRCWAKHAADYLAATPAFHRCVSGLLGLGVIVLAVCIDRANGDWLYVLIGAAAAIAALQWAHGANRVRWANQNLRDTRAETLLDLGYTLVPLQRELSRFAASKAPERRRQKSGLEQAILSAATSVGLEEHKLRSCYFKLEEIDDLRQLRHHKSVGRATEAKAAFVEGTPEGNAALSMLDRGGHLFCRDVTNDPPPGWVRSERGDYLTFISVPVVAGKTIFGMLTLDAVEIGSLTDEDVHMVAVLGFMLATIEVLCEVRRRNVPGRRARVSSTDDKG